jgi:hypothetical protein
MNELYLVVLPLVHVSSGLTEQTLTLLPSKDLATEFHPNEVNQYLEMFRDRANKYLIGGHVVGYEFHQETTDDGRVIVRVVQNVG